LAFWLLTAETARQATLADRTGGSMTSKVSFSGTQATPSTENPSRLNPAGGLCPAWTEREFVVQEAVFTRRGIDRIIRCAFEPARKSGRNHVTSAAKSNGIFYSMPFWDERFALISKEYPGVTGTIAVAPSANINPERKFLSMFEPVHGSAPDIAEGIANPIGQIWSAAMMLDRIGEPEAGKAEVEAIEQILTSAKAPLTPDMGGKETAIDLGTAIANTIRKA
jgi:tartrate dehydrogenase/decarboxylase/D-malate dehydrogenase